MTTSELILQLLKKNPSVQFTRIELATIFKKHKTTIGLCIRNILALEGLELIIVKKYERTKLIRWNDPSIIPIPHAIELKKKKRKKKKEKLDRSKINLKVKIKNNDIDSKRRNKEIYVPKKIRDQLNWEQGSKVLFIEKGNKIYCKSNSE